MTGPVDARTGKLPGTPCARATHPYLTYDATSAVISALLLEYSLRASRRLVGKIMEALQPDEALADIIGDKPRSRVEVMQNFWKYVREQGLQDAGRRVVKVDDKLKLVLGDEKKVSIFLVASLVEQHLS